MVATNHMNTVWQRTAAVKELKLWHGMPASQQPQVDTGKSHACNAMHSNSLARSGMPHLMHSSNSASMQAHAAKLPQVKRQAHGVWRR
jgi:hypothetical protein